MTAPTVSREALLHVVKNLPAAPRVLAQLGGLLLDPNSDLSDVIDLLKHDSGLTTRVIRVSNSAAYGSASRAASLEEALMRVGFNEVYRLVGLAAVANISDDNLRSYGISGTRFRENSLFTGFVAEVLAPTAEVDPRAAYTAGLLRSTGKIAIDRLLPGPVNAKSYAVAGKSRPVDQWELEVVGIENCVAAATVLEEWRFPPLTVQAIRDQYRPGASSIPLAHILNIAAGLAEKEGYGLPGELSYWGPKSSNQQPPVVLDPEELERAVMIARDRFEPARQAVG